MIVNLLFLALSFLGFDSHDVQVAFYQVHQEEGSIAIDFVFESKDLTSTLDLLDRPLSDENVEAYIQDHFELFINGKTQHLSFGELEIKNKHIYIKAETSPMPSAVQSLRVSNTCLINIDEHSNIIEINLYDRQRDFLMNRYRTTIDVKY